MKAAGAAVMLATMLLLAGCSGTKTRPAPAGGSAGAGRGHADSRADRFRDDLSRPQSSRYRDGNDSVPSPIDVSKLPEPVPKVEPRSLYGNKSPYTVLGQTYRVLPTARGYDERGIASFYGNKFHGYKTSSLETYDMYAFSAASPTLPLPSYARVTNLENGKSVIVRVNDRGPFHDNRLIDLSYAAAVKIGVWPKGTGLVEVRGIDPAHPGKELPAPAMVTSGHAGIYLQVGAFADAGNAERLAQRLRQADLGAVQVLDSVVNGRHVRRVRVGPLASVERADQVSRRIEDMGMPQPRVAVD
ncbi:MAG: septal ring lytic transglycosylase RlpA family protein [Rhodanobacter sp.]|nr:MAG: septal ring lytic transglycosylase RlpA family protein [Rhodanobacter sp.]TAM04652.1 MAG: septal ring lytic transglycosylase RlpA family protein [Rhodanobacter sp.]TAM41613.1 MAG: septal ring lytic transglycosylase RlpA family protein [Rhodanobacter sp.]TAN29458.1 MAG: septal ring lytic transglycosylase RlpA family protein [Rhodanobacter sp.]